MSSSNRAPADILALPCSLAPYTPRSTPRPMARLGAAPRRAKACRVTSTVVVAVMHVIKSNGGKSEVGLGPRENEASRQGTRRQSK